MRVVARTRFSVIAGMSSFSKNVLPRREHRERAQPASRIQKHGLLEKKKDYKLRAKDHNRKRLRIKLLREKAAFRNPDEFYYGMINSSTNNGRVTRVRNTKQKDILPIANRDREQRLLAETQDSRYVQLKSNLENGAVKSMKERLHFLARAPITPRRHFKFEENEYGEERLVQFNRVNQNPNESEPISPTLSPQEAKFERKQARKQALAYQQMDRRSARLGKLEAVLIDMQAAKNLLKKGRRFLVRPSDPVTGAPPVYRWQRERRR